MNTDRVVDITKVGFCDRYYEKFRGLLVQVADGRFTQQSSAAFALMKKLTRYNTFEKRDGGIMNAAYVEGKLVDGEELNIRILEHFKAVHTRMPGFDADTIRFPEVQVDGKTLAAMCNNVSQGKGITFDSVSEEWFRIGGDNDCRRLGTFCSDCLRKLTLAQSLLRS